MLVIKRPINGITLNPMEYVLTDDSKDVRKFKDTREALNLLGFATVEEAADNGIYIEEE